MTIAQANAFGVVVHTPATARPTASASASGWMIRERPGTGTFIESEAGTLLFRVEVQSGAIVLYPFDKKIKREIRITLPALAGVLHLA